MKVSVAALFLLILILTMTSAFHSKTKSPESVNIPHTCCLKYHKKIIPRKLVVGHREALGCYLPAIIFITKKNREICTNPNEKWVQDYIDDPNLPLLPPRNMVPPGTWSRLNLLDHRKAKPSSSATHDDQASAESQVQERKV